MHLVLNKVTHYTIFKVVNFTQNTYREQTLITIQKISDEAEKLINVIFSLACSSFVTGGLVAESIRRMRMSQEDESELELNKTCKCKFSK